MVTCNLIWTFSIVVVLVFSEVLSMAVSVNTPIFRYGVNKAARCGTDDYYVASEPRVRRNAPTDDGPRWNKRIITYKIVSKSRSLDEVRVEALVAKAFAAWVPYCGLWFVRLEPTAPRADITISFGTRKHGTCEQFDGHDGVVAHASYPSENGASIHFDDDEMWDDNGNQRFYLIALHEIGHALGLHHINEKRAIMYGYEEAETTHLHDADISHIRQLYDYFVATEASPDKPPGNIFEGSGDESDDSGDDSEGFGGISEIYWNIFDKSNMISIFDSIDNSSPTNEDPSNESTSTNFTDDFYFGIFTN